LLQMFVKGVVEIKALEPIPVDVGHIAVQESDPGHAKQAANLLSLRSQPRPLLYTEELRGRSHRSDQTKLSRTRADIEYLAFLPGAQQLSGAAGHSERRPVADRQATDGWRKNSVELVVRDRLILPQPIQHHLCPHGVEPPRQVLRLSRFLNHGFTNYQI